MSDQNLADDQLVALVRRAYSRHTAPAAVRPMEPGGSAGTRPRFSLPLAGVATATAGIVLVLVAQALGQPPSAFATWTTVPDEPDDGLAASVAEECSAGLPLVAVDQRGRAAVALFSDGDSLADCLLVDGKRSAASYGAQPGRNPRAGAIEVLNHGRYERDSPIHIFSGGVEAGVASVIVTRDDGVDVTATVAGDVFVVWWPTDVDAASFTALDEAGATIETIQNPIRLPPPLDTR